ncbi:MAG: poly(3-hydroxybutyrate) depolymerase [Rhodocyclaceae bacterium]|nr:poly(3-hydroxybutyrate) depolymerase [Rhodocyclaceae bacterium]
MAVQFHVAHSATVAGAGVLAGGPYECASGSAWLALTRCMAPRFWSPLPEVSDLRARIGQRAERGQIDDPAGLAADRVWLFSGGQDETVEAPVMDTLEAEYRSYLPAASIEHVRLPDAGHAMISIQEPAPNACATSDPPFINRCADFDAAGRLLAAIHGPLAPPAEPPVAAVRAFDQRPFLGEDPASTGMADEGYVLVPGDCEAGGCRIHVAFHGCRQTTEQIGDRFVRNAGYVEWAWTNRIVVLFPQVRPTYGWTGGFSWLYNPKGCWDWWGYTDADYATRDGRQIRAVQAMIERLAAPVMR